MTFQPQCTSTTSAIVQILCVSRHPATPTDVYHLEANLDRRLDQSRALEVGLCPHRRRIYDECFDELVRQVTIECSERGILLSRVRHAYRQMMRAYREIYSSANAYAMRTLLLSERVKLQVNTRVDHLQFDVDHLKQQLMNAEDHLENVLRLQARTRSLTEYRYEPPTRSVPVELQQLRAANVSLKEELESVLVRKLNVHAFEKEKRSKTAERQ